MRPLVLGVLALSGCAPAQAPEPAISPHTEVVHRAQVQSFTCKASHGGTRASVVVQNTGADPIPHAKVFFRIGDQIVDTYLSPSTIPPGALASADRMAKPPGPCQLVALQDGRGNAVALSTK